MAVKNLFKHLLEAKKKGVMFHRELRRIMMICGMRHYNRVQEMQTLEEFLDVECIERYWNHYGDGTYLESPPIDEQFAKKLFAQKGLSVGEDYNYNSLNPKDVQDRLEGWFECWLEYETETADVISKLYMSCLLEEKSPYHAEYLCKHLKDVMAEIKKVRIFIREAKLVGWDLKVLCSPSYQGLLHDEYRDRADGLTLDNVKGEY